MGKVYFQQNLLFSGYVNRKTLTPRERKKKDEIKYGKITQYRKAKVGKFIRIEIPIREISMTQKSSNNDRHSLFLFLTRLKQRALAYN